MAEFLLKLVKKCIDRNFQTYILINRECKVKFSFKTK